MTLNEKGHVFSGSEKIPIDLRISYFIFCPFRGDVYLLANAFLFLQVCVLLFLVPACNKISMLISHYRVNVNEIEERRLKKDWHSVVVPSSVKLATDPLKPLKQYY
jgi:hypothetical protein